MLLEKTGIVARLPTLVAAPVIIKSAKEGLYPINEVVGKSMLS